MPLYEYYCSMCDERHEKLRPVRERDQKATCPECSNRMIRVAAEVSNFVMDPAKSVRRPQNMGGD